MVDIGCIACLNLRTLKRYELAINKKNKGAEGERDIANRLNDIVRQVRGRYEHEQLAIPPFQRNQNQSAVGGSDLSNPFGLSIEVKRQEVLSIQMWWKQTVKSAREEDGMPILIFRQNNKKWRVLMEGVIGSDLTSLKIPVEIDIKTFEAWFERYYYYHHINSGLLE